MRLFARFVQLWNFEKCFYNISFEFSGSYLSGGGHPIFTGTVVILHSKCYILYGSPIRTYAILPLHVVPTTTINNNHNNNFRFKPNFLLKTDFFNVPISRNSDLVFTRWLPSTSPSFSRFGCLGSSKSSQILSFHDRWTNLKKSWFAWDEMQTWTLKERGLH